MFSKDQNVLHFLATIAALVEGGIKFKMTFSKARPGNKELSNVYLKPVDLKKGFHYSVTYRYAKKDQVKNIEANAIIDHIEAWLTETFFNAVVFTEEKQITLMQNKKGTSHLSQQHVAEKIVINTQHDHQKLRCIPEDRPWLQALGLASKENRIFDKSQDKYRQINKYVEIIDHLLKDVDPSQIFNVADMGCGKGYLTFALYDHLVNTKKMRCKVIGYEIREDIVALCYNVAANEGFVGLTFQQKNIDQVNVTGQNMVIALHACDIATDMAIAKGIEANASFIVVSPCCHQQIRKAMHHQNDLSPILVHGILEERQAEIITDGIRALLMQAHGYKTQVIEFISTEHTSKNLMIIGTKSKPDESAFAKVEAIKKMFGIEQHYLERALTEQKYRNQDIEK